MLELYAHGVGSVAESGTYIGTCINYQQAHRIIRQWVRRTVKECKSKADREVDLLLELKPNSVLRATERRWRNTISSGLWTEFVADMQRPRVPWFKRLRCEKQRECGGCCVNVNGCHDTRWFCSASLPIRWMKDLDRMIHHV